MGVGKDDVVGDLLAGRDERQRQAVLGLQGQRASEPVSCGVRLPVVSDGEFVPPGTTVQVVTVQGNRIVVRPEENEPITAVSDTETPGLSSRGRAFCGFQSARH